MLVVSNSDIQLVMTVSESTEDITIPSGAIGKTIGESLIMQHNLGNQLDAVIRHFPSSGIDSTVDVLADYSGVGPTADGRIKPDLVAPGETLSAAKGPPGMGSCDTGDFSGTSMSTPLVGAAAALVRQYFMDGYHPAGLAGSGPAFTPSGPLVKAVLINGAEELTGVAEASGLQVPAGPNPLSGFGRLSLTQSLPLPSAPGGKGIGKNEWRMEVVNNATLASTDTFHVYKGIKVKGGPLKVTLVWYDYPAEASVESPLVNDLDLAVTFKGNQMSIQQHLGNGQADHLNTVEKVLYIDRGNHVLTTEHLAKHYHYLPLSDG